MGIVNPSETECLAINLKGLALSEFLSNSVSTVASVIIKKSDTTRLEIVSRVRLLFRRMFFRTSFANFICFTWLLAASYGADAVRSFYALFGKSVQTNECPS